MEKTLAGSEGTAAVPQLQPRRREYGLDWLRVIAFAILIGYHTGMYFVPWPWSVKNPVISQWLTFPMLFLNRWRLPLLFFISGAGVWFNLNSRGYRRFLGERSRRLLIPLAFGMLVVVPPQIYVERALAGQHYPSYFQFWATVFTSGPYPRGNLSWHHLWFLPYILTYCVAGLPLFAFFRSRTGRATVERLVRLCEIPGFIYLINVPNFVAAWFLNPHWPATMNLVSDWANFTGYLLTFLWGFLLCSSTRFLDLVERRRYEYLAVAGATAVLLFWAYPGPLLDALAPGPRRLGWELINAYFSMSMILALVGWSRAWLNRDSAALRWGNSAVYPFYIVHQTVTILLGYWWMGWNVPIPLKFAMLLSGTFLVSWACFEAVRRTRLTRVLFGMKPA
jgi:glucan biosynthesis protein C